MTGLIGRKLGMTRVFDADGAAGAVRVIEAGPCPVVQIAGNRIELGFGARKPKRAARALLGHVKRAGLEVAPRVLQSFPLAGEGAEPPKPGEAVTVAIFQAGERRFTELGLRVVKVDAERNLLFVRGAVPGPMNGLLTIRKQGGRSRHD